MGYRGSVLELGGLGFGVPKPLFGDVEDRKLDHDERQIFQEERGQPIEYPAFIRKPFNMETLQQGNRLIRKPFNTETVQYGNRSICPSTKGGAYSFELNISRDWTSGLPTGAAPAL